MKTGVVDVGGGLRGIYAVGVLDYCMDCGIRFDLGIGVSAGSANLASYAAGQRGRNHQFYTEYAFRRQYMSLSNFIRKKSFINMDYVYGMLSDPVPVEKAFAPGCDRVVLILTKPVDLIRTPDKDKNTVCKKRS